MAFLNQTGLDPLGKTVVIPISGVAASTTIPLGANATWESGIIPYAGNIAASLAMQSDQSGTYTISYYDQNNNPITFTGNATLYDPSVSTAFQAALTVKGHGIKIKYTNGSVAQSAFYLEIRLGDSFQETLRSLGVPASSTNLASTTHAVLEGRENGTGGYKQTTLTQNGNKVALDVNNVNPLDISTLSKDATLTNGSARVSIVNGNNQVYGSQASPFNVSITNQPTTQPISGSVSVSNLPTTQAISGNVGVNNFPASQVVSGTVSVGNFPASQAITGSVNINSLPTSSNAATTTQNTLATVTTALPANAARKGATIFSVTGTILVKLGAAASTTSYTTRIVTNGYYEVPFDYTGIITVIGAGTINVTELT